MAIVDVAPEEIVCVVNCLPFNDMNLDELQEYEK